MRLPSPKWVLLLLPVTVIFFCFWVVWTRGENERVRLQGQQERIDQEAARAEAALKAYAPKEDIDWAALPGVAKVEKLVTVAKPTQRIVHVRDLPYLSKDLLAKEVKPKDLENAFEETYLQVNLVQVDQLALLRGLIQGHGLKKVFAEGLTPEGVPAFKDRIALLRGRQRPTQAKALAHYLEDLVEMGAPSRLLILDELKDVLPLEDKTSLEQAKLQARQDAMVRQALKAGDLAIIVLSGAHDLSASVRAASKTCEYLRLTTRNYPKE